MWLIRSPCNMSSQRWLPSMQLCGADDCGNLEALAQVSCLLQANGCERRVKGLLQVLASALLQGRIQVAAASSDCPDLRIAQQPGRVGKVCTLPMTGQEDPLGHLLAGLASARLDLMYGLEGPAGCTILTRVLLSAHWLPCHSPDGS